MPVGCGRAEVVDKLAAGDEVDEVVHDIGRRAADLQEGEQAEAEREEQGPEWDTGLGTPREKARGVAFERHAVQGAGCREEEAVSSAEDGRHDKRVDEGGQSVDLEPLHCDDVGPVQKTLLG